METPLNQFQTVISRLFVDRPGWDSPAGVDISGQFKRAGDDPLSLYRKLNAAFLVLLAGKSHPDHGEALEFVETLAGEPSWREAASFYREGLERIKAEISREASGDPRFAEALDGVSSRVFTPAEGGMNNPFQAAELFWRLFFPEGVSVLKDRDSAVGRLREKRTIRITRLNPDPVVNPPEEILFTSNILLTIPPESTPVEKLPLTKKLREALKKTAAEPQRYWYDHPIQIGVEAAHHEAIYGLKGLSEALQFERERGVAGENARLTCVLSVSATHEGLQAIARDYLEETLQAHGGIRNIDAFVFTEIDAGRLVDEVLVPAAKRYVPGGEFSSLGEIFGTDGEYGRHYSFLKAIAGLWQIFINPQIKGTFKTDLDQVFPQEDLVEQTGASAFEHFKTPLWGAEGIDHKGQEVELGMIAGALVNQRDIHRGLFTPDVTFPSNPPKADEMVFFSKVPQALSTEAEMMTRYGEGAWDGGKRCIQRIHVTGGTNGILIRALRKHRPFTPVFIGRAEDQAFLLSVLFPESGPALRYVHKDGLIMRHDKEAMAAGAIRAAALGKMIGDTVRILVFSSYARALSWPVDEIKETVDPFTGCFISRIPVTVAYLRCALKAASFFGEGTEESGRKGGHFLELAVRRLSRVFREDRGEPNPLAGIYRREKAGWNLFYDLLDFIERGLKNGDPFAAELRERARGIVEGCKIGMG